MRIGTKSLLFGVHQVFLHPLFVLWGWCKLYGWPNWKELICIIIHDWGYRGCADMDGSEGNDHSKYGAYLALKYLDNIRSEREYITAKRNTYSRFLGEKRTAPLYHYNLCLFHSRFFSEYYNETPSKLCWADKLGTALYPPWLWVLLGTLTGGIKEYITVQKHRDLIQETNPFKFFKVYRDKIVPDLLKENGVIK